MLGMQRARVEFSGEGVMVTAELSDIWQVNVLEGHSKMWYQ